MDGLSAVFGARVQFRYTCLDRIVLHGYLTGLQRPGQLVKFFHDVVGVACIEPTVLAGRTTAYRRWLAQYTQGQGIPVVAAPPGVRKEGLVQPYSMALGPREGVACVLTSKLQTVLDRRNEGHPILRAYSQPSFVKQYEQAETLLRTETCILACPDAGGDPRHLNVKRRLDHLPQLVEAAFHQVDLALDQLCTTRGLTLAA